MGDSSRTPMIPVNTPDIGPLERDLVAQCLAEGWISSEGPWIERFEQACATRFHRRHAIAVSNGSVALDAAVAALRLGPGDEVIVPSFTIISCAAAVVRAGATPVFVDADPATWCLDTSLIEQAISPRTRAIMPVHIYGLPCDMRAISALAARHGLAIIEDAAEVHGQTYDGRPCGSFGDVSTLSFYANKHVTTGEGGMILTDDDGIASRCRSLRNLFFKPERRFVHDELGWNLRMGSLQAALGIAQLSRLDEFVSRKRALGGMYRETLADMQGITLPAESAHGSDNHYWVFGVVLDESLGVTAMDMMRILAESGVGTRPFFYPMHSQPVLQTMGLVDGRPRPVAERLGRQGFYLPSGLGTSHEQAATAAAALIRALGRCHVAAPAR